MNYASWAVAIALGYLAGSIPFGFLIGRAKGVDLRTVGSGNIGATNCGRVLGRRYGLLCFGLDLLKGFTPVLLAGWWFGQLGGRSPDARMLGMWLGAAVAAILGHVFPVWLKFRGGKGVSTGFGAVLGVWPYLTIPAIGAAAVWAIMLAACRYVSLASIVAALSLPGWFSLTAWRNGWSLGDVWPVFVVTIAMSMLIVVLHRANVARLVRGAEPKVGRRRANP